jgi:hypothetical protein
MGLAWAAGASGWASEPPAQSQPREHPDRDSPGAVGGSSAGPLATFTLQEHFGVSHAGQVVVFELRRAIEPGNCHLVDHAGREAPFQWVEGGPHGGIAFSTDLPAGTTRAFRLFEGRGQPSLDGVRVDETHPGYLEIVNGLTGIRVPKPYAPLTETPKAPIQGARFRDGSWSPPATPLEFKNSNGEGGITRVDSLTVTVKERGPVRAIVEVRYDITSPECRYGALLTRPAGPAHYTTTVTLERGQPSVLIETDTDLNSTFSLSLYAGARPSQLRYCGHHATEAGYGRLADGSVYPPSHARPNMDALVDLDYSRSVEVGYSAGPNSRPWMALWNPWAVNSGWYWQLYDADGKPESNLAGIFAGPPSRLVGAGGSGVGIYSRPGPDLGITVLSNLRGGDNTLFLNTSKRTIRFAWGIFAGVRSDAPADLAEVPAIKRQFCLHGNGLNLQKLLRWQLDYPDPNPPFGAMYMPRPAIQRMIQRLRADETYYQGCRASDPYNRDLFDMWRDTTGAKARAMADALHQDMRGLVDDWANGHSYLSTKFSTQPWLIPPSKTDRYDQVLAGGFLDPGEKARMKAGIALFANWLWDDDQYPFQSGERGEFLAMVNMGTANMPAQWMGARGTYTWFIASHPAMAPRLGQSLPEFGQINEFGASAACPHYAGTFTPNHNVVMQRGMLGYKDWEAEPRLARFAEWLLNMMTPPDVRYGGIRSIIVDGDGEPCDGSPLLGEMASACAGSHPALSRRLNWMWAANGRRHSGFYSSTHLRINEELPAEDPQLGNVVFPGYCAVLRNSWNTPRETSAHCIMGDFYTDHRGSSSGELILYALGAPLSLGWESMYNPHNPTPYSRATVVPERALPMTWNADLPSLNDPADPWNWSSQKQEAFAAFTDSASAVMSSVAKEGGLDWTRQVVSVHPDPSYPLLLVCDTFKGGRAAEPMIFNLHLMAEGPVGTSAGAITPREAFWDIHDARRRQTPSGGMAYPLPAGLNQFSFTGQQFGRPGETPAIDWDLYSLAHDPREFCLGSWGHNNAGPAGGFFQQANGRPYEQRQHILHLKGTGGFTTLIAPRRKGTEAPGVSRDGAGFRVGIKGATLLLSAEGYSYAGADKTVVTAFGGAPMAAEGISVEGGPTEVVHDRKAGTVTVTAHGTAGKRVVGVPAGQWQARERTWTSNEPLGKWTVEYPGGKVGEARPATLLLLR